MASLSPEILINGEQGCYVVIFRSLINKEKADILYHIAENYCVEKYQIQMYGKLIQQPRTNCAFSDPHITSHKYNSAGSVPTKRWISEIEEIRDMFWEYWRVYLDSTLLNGYSDGLQYIGKHSDKELKDKHQFVITVSTGASRRFVIEWIDSKKKIETVLHHGDVVLMYGNTNKLTKHELPKDKSVLTPRFSYTFRCLAETTAAAIEMLLLQNPNIDLPTLKAKLAELFKW